MLQDLDATLKKVLLRAKTEIPGLLAVDDVRFATPDSKFSPDGQLLDLFLLDVIEDRELRDSRPIRELVGEVYITHQAPLRVDCTYLVTAWSNETGETKSLHEHQLLGEAMLWLSRFATIPDTLLEGAMSQSIYPPSLAVAHSRDDRQSGQFWSALGISPRPAFFLTATIAMDAQVALDQARRVAEVLIRTGVGWSESGLDGQAASQLRYVGGQVLGVTQSQGTAATPLAGARVTVQPDGLAATTDGEGRYYLGPLPEGTHHIFVKAVGYPDADREVSVPLSDPKANYDFTVNRP